MVLCMVISEWFEIGQDAWKTPVKYVNRNVHTFLLGALLRENTLKFVVCSQTGVGNFQIVKKTIASVISRRL